MTEDDTLVKALDDVRKRRAELQRDYELIAAELAKLQLAENSLAAIVEGAPLDLSTMPSAPAYDSRPMDEFAAPSQQRAPARGTRGARGPRANSAKGRLKALLMEAGPQGLTHAEIGRRLPDVASGTLATYLSVMASGGEAERRGDFYTAGRALHGGEPMMGEETDDADHPSDHGIDFDEADE